MMKKNGFTLVEILLAVMIICIIGLALAAITTAALRESGVGRTRVVLRNQLSVAVRQMRQDIQLANTVNASGTTLVLNYEPANKVGPTIPTQLPSQVVYYFRPGQEPAPGGTNGGTIGGEIYRSATIGGGTKTTLWLDNVKNITSTSGVHYPSFTGGEDGRVRVRLIVQSNAFPVINEAFDETFYTPHGAAICDERVSTLNANC